MAVIKTILFYDLILFWSVNCINLDKKIGHIFQKNRNSLKFWRRYNFCFEQKNRAGLQLPPYYSICTSKRGIWDKFTEFTSLKFWNLLSETRGISKFQKMRKFHLATWLESESTFMTVFTTTKSFDKHCDKHCDDGICLQCPFLGIPSLWGILFTII